MRRRHPIAALVLIAIATIAQATDGERERLVREGLEAYAEAQATRSRDARLAAFARAEQRFRQAARDPGASADLHANAGTAALQGERLGAAVLALRRALVIDPDHDRARRNLAHARGLLPDWVPVGGGGTVLDSFFFWHRSLSSAERSGAGAACFVLAAIGLAVSLARGSRVARSLALLPALGWGGLTLSLLLDAGADPAREAVITADETVARASDSANAPARFPDPLPGGTEVEVVEIRSRWARVRLVNAREAWVTRASLQTVRAAEADSP